MKLREKKGKMFQNLKQKVKNCWLWIKKQTKKIIFLILGIGVALAVTTLNGEVPSVIAEGKTIEFAYTDENVGENIIIRTDQEFYNPLWAWNGFDVYVMVSNESGKTQHVSVSPFFSKDFTIESIAILNPSATTIIKEPIYEEVCSATSTECWDEKIGEEDKEVIGRWNNVLNPTFFSEEDYQQFVSDKKIKVKDKGNRKAKQKFGALFLKNQTVYFKIKLKANEPFSIEEFDLEIIGDKGAYGLLDPTIMTEDFNSCLTEDLDTNAGCTGWAGSTNWDVQGVVVKEGAKAVECVSSGAIVSSAGTPLTDGRTTFYFRRTANDTGYLGVFIQRASDNANSITVWVGSGAQGSNTVEITHNAAYIELAGTWDANVWYSVEVEWRSAPADEYRARLNGGAWSVWGAPFANRTWGAGGLHKVYLTHNLATSYVDYIAEDPLLEVRRIMDIE